MTARSGRGGGSVRWFLRLSVAALAFGAGLQAVWTEAAPWKVVRRGVKSLAGMVAAQKEGRLDSVMWLADVSADSIEARRIRMVAPGGLRDPVVAEGGWWQFDEHCPEGCLAVEYGGPVESVRATPFRPDLLDAARIADSPREKTFGANSNDEIETFYMTAYPNGDLLAVFFYPDFHFPSFAGVARVKRGGEPIWHRRDYSHHEPHVAAGDTAWVPGAELEEDVRLPGDLGVWSCERHPTYVDVVNVLDADGALVEQVSLVAAFAQSPWASVLLTADPCDPFHLNSVSLVRDDVSGLDGVRPGDVVLSMRHLSAVAILDGRTHALKRYVTGTFGAQHSVKHLRGSEFVMFDNNGGHGRRRDGARYAYSRVLVVDFATGEETVVFPKSDSERHRNWITTARGRISISPDGERALASYTEQGRAVEVRIEDGEVLAEFDFLHDMRRSGLRPPDSNVLRSTNTNAFYGREASR